MTIAHALRRLFARVPATGLPPIFTAVYRPAAGPPNHRAVTPRIPLLSAPDLGRVSASDLARVSASDHARVSAPHRPGRSAR